MRTEGSGASVVVQILLFLYLFYGGVSRLLSPVEPKPRDNENLSDIQLIGPEARAFTCDHKPISSVYVSAGGFSTRKYWL